MTDNDEPAKAGPAALPEDSSGSALPPDRSPRDRYRGTSSDVSDDVHAVARGGGATGGWVNRRRDKIVAEIERNRRGEYKVPTWVLALILVVVLVAWAALIITS